MGPQKTFRRGEQILREGERSSNAYVVVSGMVTVFVTKQKKNIELFKATSGQILGEEAFFDLPAASSATAMNETVLMELPAARTKAILDASDPFVGEIFKAIVDKQKTFFSELRSVKADQDSTPCPPDNVAKVFASLYHVANYYGEHKDGKVVIPWVTLKRLAQRIFLESPIRLEQAFNICVKLKLAEVKMVKAEVAKAADKKSDGKEAEEMGPCTFHDLKAVERFFDFFQNYHFKGTQTGVLKYDEKCRLIAGAMVQASERERVDRSGVVYMNYKALCDSLRGILGASFNAEHIMRLEQKGLFVKRQSSATGGTISFIRTEFIQMLDCWKILKEVEKWNELGFVDLSEPKAVPAAAGGAVPGAPVDPNAPILTCDTCLSQITAASRFCSACGAKVEKAA